MKRWEKNEKLISDEEIRERRWRVECGGHTPYGRGIYGTRKSFALFTIMDAKAVWTIYTIPLMKNLKYYVIDKEI